MLVKVLARYNEQVVPTISVVPGSLFNTKSWHADMAAMSVVTHLGCEIAALQGWEGASMSVWVCPSRHASKHA